MADERSLGNAAQRRISKTLINNIDLFAGHGGSLPNQTCFLPAMPLARGPARGKMTFVMPTGAHRGSPAATKAATRPPVLRELPRLVAGGIELDPDPDRLGWLRSS